MNRHTVYQLNGIKALMNYNDRDDMEMNDNMQNVDVSSGIGLTNIQTTSQCNRYINLNEMNWDFKNGDVSGGNCYMNSHTGSEAKNNKSIDSTKKVMKILTTDLKWKIMDCRMVLKLMSCYLHQKLINIPIYNKIMNIITPISMVKCQHQKTHQFIN